MKLLSRKLHIVFAVKNVIQYIHNTEEVFAEGAKRGAGKMRRNGADKKGVTK